MQRIEEVENIQMIKKKVNSPRWLLGDNHIEKQFQKTRNKEHEHPKEKVIHDEIGVGKVATQHPFGWRNIWINISTNKNTSLISKKFSQSIGFNQLEKTTISLVNCLDLDFWDNYSSKGLSFYNGNNSFDYTKPNTFLKTYFFSCF